MPRPSREPPRPFFTKSEARRFVSMSFLLLILFMIITQTRNGGISWLVSRSGGKDQVVGTSEDQKVELVEKGTKKSPPASAAETTAPAATPPADKSSAKDSPSQPAPAVAPSVGGAAGAKDAARQPAAGEAPAGNAAAGEPTAPKKIPAATGPTDEDPDEQSDGVEDFDAIYDESPALKHGDEELGVNRSDYPAYRRITRWVVNQPYERLAARVTDPAPRWSQFIQSPESCRKYGTIFKLDLRVRRVDSYLLKFDDTDEPQPPVQLYEMWGTTKRDPSRLYQVIVYDPPEGLEIGENVQDDVQFVGYFFKRWGYIPASEMATGERKVQMAPTLIGRVAMKVRPPSVIIGSSDLLWVSIIGGGVLLVLAIWIGWMLLNRRKMKVSELAGELAIPRSVSIDEWLDRPHKTDETDGNNSGSSAEYMAGEETHDTHQNGHANGTARLFPDQQDSG